MPAAAAGRYRENGQLDAENDADYEQQADDDTEEDNGTPGNGVGFDIDSLAHRPPGGRPGRLSGIPAAHMFGHDPSAGIGDGPGLEYNRNRQAPAPTGEGIFANEAAAPSLAEIQNMPMDRMQMYLRMMELQAECARYKVQAAQAGWQQQQPGNSAAGSGRKRRRNGSAPSARRSSAASRSTATGPHCKAVSTFIGKLVGDCLDAKEDPYLRPILGTDTTAQEFAHKLLQDDLAAQFPDVFGDQADDSEEVLAAFLEKPRMTNDEKAAEPLYSPELEGGVTQFLDKYRSQAGSRATNIVQQYCVSARIRFIDTRPVAEPDPAEKADYVSRMKAIQEKISHLNNDPIGCPHFQFAHATQFAPELLAKSGPNTYTGFKPNVQKKFDLLQLAFTRCKLRLRREEPDLKKVSSKGMSHGAALAAEVKLLRQELAANSSTSAEVVNSNQTDFITEEVELYYNKKFGESVSETQDLDVRGNDDQPEGAGAGQEV